MHPQSDLLLSANTEADYTTITESFVSADISLIKSSDNGKMNLEDSDETGSNHESHEGDGENSESDSPISPITKMVRDLDQDKDSGIEFSAGDQDESFELPDKELVAKIINQVEFYFSNENILKDPFLLKHVRRNKEGYVSLKLIATFRKVKTFTKNWKVVAYSLKQSSRLEVNEQNTKVRRVEPLPNHDETVPSRTLLITNLPFDKPTMENVGEMVSKYGEVALIRILRPGGGSPSSDMKELKKFLVKHPEVAESVYAVVEFEKHEFAANAMKDLNNRKDLKGIKAFHLADKNADHVVPLNNKANQPTPPVHINNNNNNNHQRHSISHVPHSQPKQLSNAEQAKRESVRTAAIKKRKNKKISALQHSGRNDGDTTNPASSCSESDHYSPEIRRRSSSSISSNYSCSPRSMSIGEYFAERRNTGPSIINRANNNNNNNSPAVLRRHSSNSNSRPFRLSESEAAASPWVQRRMQLAARDSSSSLNSHTQSRTLVPEGVIRLPFGPDGTRGFAGRTRAQTAP